MESSWLSPGPVLISHTIFCMAGANDYFSFSKRERTGVIVLIILIAIIFLLPEFFPIHKTSQDSSSVAAFRKEISALNNVDTDSSASASGINADAGYPVVSESSNEHHQKALLFYFDPNTISGEEWKKLGVRDRTIQTIRKYISKGGRFRMPEDLRKIYGLQKDQCEQLLPFVRIKNMGKEKQRAEIEYRKPPVYNKTITRPPSIIEMNEADTTMLIALPGIGSKLANRILNFRDKLHGFYSVDQVKETFGLPDSTFQIIKPFLQCDASRVQKININTADAVTLKQHPYIKWNIANAVISYRQQHGDYKSVEELLKIDIISPEIFQKIAHYLTVN